MTLITSILRLNMNTSLVLYSILLAGFQVQGEESEGEREGKDLIYEAMKMRTGNWKTRDPARVTVVGGGILEKRILGDRGGIQEHEGPQHESRGTKSYHL